MKTASVCRSCERRLLACNRSPAPFQPGSFPLRAYVTATHRESRGDPLVETEWAQSSSRFDRSLDEAQPVFWDDALPAEFRQVTKADGIKSDKLEAQTSRRDSILLGLTSKPCDDGGVRTADGRSHGSALPSRPSNPTRRSRSGLRSFRKQQDGSAQVELLPPLSKHVESHESGLRSLSPNSRPMWDDPREHGRESYQWKLSNDLMKSAGTFDESSRQDFIRWKRKYRAIPRWTATGTPLGLDATVENWLQRLDKDEDMRIAFERLEQQERLEKWPKIMMTTLKHRPQKTHLVLSATLDPLLPPYAVMDTLLFIVSSLPKEEHLYKNEQDRDLARNVVQLFLRVKDTFPALPFEQRTLGLAASRLPRHHFERLFTSLEIPLSELHENTALQFARKLAGTIDEASKATSKWAALEILEHLATRGEKVNTDKFRSVITPLLHHNPPEDEVRPFDTKVAFSSLWDKGFRPNIINVTTYLDTACLAGDVKYAITVAKLFRDHGLPFDSRALDVLFRGAKHMNESSMIDELLQLSKATGIDMFSNALHAILYSYTLEARQHKRYNVPDLRPFLPMLRIFAKRCSLEKLQQLIPESLPLMLTQNSEDNQASSTDQRRWEFEHSIVPVVDASFPSLSQKQAESSIGTMAIMFRAYIKSMRRSHELLSLWMSFKLKLEAPGTEDNVAAKLVRHQKSLIHDTFIMEMLKHPGFKRPALDVFGDMLNSMLKGKGQSAHPEPSVFTFTILLNRLITQGEHVLADELYQVMRENGVEPNLATMNTRVKTAAMAQNVDRTVSALSELETIYQPDRWTFKAFGRLRRQQQALKMIQEIIDVRKRQLDAEEQGH